MPEHAYNCSPASRVTGARVRVTDSLERRVTLLAMPHSVASSPWFSFRGSRAPSMAAPCLEGPASTTVKPGEPSRITMEPTARASHGRSRTGGYEILRIHNGVVPSPLSNTKDALLSAALVLHSIVPRRRRRRPTLADRDDTEIAGTRHPAPTTLHSPVAVEDFRDGCKYHHGHVDCGRLSPCDVAPSRWLTWRHPPLPDGDVAARHLWLPTSLLHQKGDVVARHIWLPASPFIAL
ncbi:hypothetical protein B0H11DRAFT_1987746 [Mycena galericulata]|nr:hypothetical protein B0H11DRAFT_1987746 [Mycena galericulata]